MDVGSQVGFLFVDVPVRYNIEKNVICFFQNKISIKISKSDTVVFMPFSNPLEDFEHTNINIVTYKIILDNCGIEVFNDPFQWLLCYDKSYLLSISGKNICAPDTIISECPKFLKFADFSKKKIIKDGYGISRSFEGEHLHASCFCELSELDIIPMHRYAVQAYYPAVREYRQYIWQYNGSIEIVNIEVPIGTEDEPDWRNTISHDNFVCNVVKNKKLDEIAQELISESKLIYLCIDIIESDNKLYVIDINPHGSWYWLPIRERKLVGNKFKNTIQSVLRGKES